MRFLILSLLIVFSSKLLAESDFIDHSGHQHGHAEAYISFIDQVAKVKLVLPSIDIFGFEHNPNDEQQLNKVRIQIKLLENSQNLFSINSSCKQIHAEVVSGITVENVLDNSNEHDDEHHHEEIESHSNVTTTYELTCESDRVTQISFNLFKVYPSIEKLELQFVSKRGSNNCSDDT